MALNLGTDLGLTADGDLDLAFPLVSGRACLLADLVRRLRTRAGSLFWAPTVGIDLEDQVQRSHSAATLSRLRSQVVAELVADERVRSAQCAAEISGRTLTLRISVTEHTDPTTHLELVLAIDAVSVKVLKAA